MGERSPDHESPRRLSLRGDAAFLTPLVLLLVELTTLARLAAAAGMLPDYLGRPSPAT